MAVFSKIKAEGIVTYIGVVNSRERTLASSPIEKTDLEFEGIKGEYHGGYHRPSCSRVSSLYTKGTPIANSRQLSIMSDEELQWIANEANIKENKAEWWGANIVIEGIKNLSSLPPSSRIQFPSGATIRVDVENGPCKYTAQLVAEHTGGDPKAILAAAKYRRGLVGAVEAEGHIALGDNATIFIPESRPFQP